MREARLPFSLLAGRPALQAGKAPLTPAWDRLPCSGACLPGEKHGQRWSCHSG